MPKSCISFEFFTKTTWIDDPAYVVYVVDIENDKMQINVESLSKGIYFLKINNNLKTKKIIKN